MHALWFRATTVMLATCAGLTACGSSTATQASDSRTYCQSAKLPDDLHDKIDNFVLGDVTEQNKAAITAATGLLRTTASDPTAPNELRSAAADVADVLDRVASGQKPNDNDLNKFNILGEKVDKACPHN